jgi:uncharacterized membrane protein
MNAYGKLAGLIVGLVFGWIWIQAGFADAVLVMVVGLVGSAIGAVATGEVDLAEILARRSR